MPGRLFPKSRCGVQEQNDSPVSCITFDHHTLAIANTEPSIMWMIYAPNSCLTLPMCPERATASLQAIDNLFRIMHQSLSTMITSQGYLPARAALKSFLFKFMPGFCKRDGWCTLHDMYSPMTPHRGLPFIPLKDPCFQGAIQHPVCSQSSADHAAAWIVMLTPHVTLTPPIPAVCVQAFSLLCQHLPRRQFWPIVRLTAAWPPSKRHFSIAPCLLMTQQHCTSSCPEMRSQSPARRTRPQRRCKSCTLA